MVNNEILGVRSPNALFPIINVNNAWLGTLSEFLDCLTLPLYLSCLLFPAFPLISFREATFP